MKITDNLQLAKTIQLSEIKYPCRAEIKVDGVRLPLIDGKFYTRTGKEVPLNTKINSKGLFIDLEVTLDSTKMEERAKISGMINSAMKGGTIDESLLRFNVFDIMCYNDYLSRICNSTYRERLETLEEFLYYFKDPMFRIVNFEIVYTENELLRHYSEILALGYEGLIIKQPDDFYQFKRSKQWGKLKLRKTADIKCFSTRLGKGKYSEMIGALELSGEVDGTPVILSVGSGMTDSDRAMSAGCYLGKTIEVEYSHITQDSKTGIYSLNQPTFVCVREDK